MKKGRGEESNTNKWNERDGMQIKERNGKNFVIISLHEGQVYNRLTHIALVSKCASRKCLIHTQHVCETSMVAMITINSVYACRPEMHPENT